MSSNSENKVNVAFTGDIIFNNNYIDLYNSGINPFVNLNSVFFDKDFVIGNLECLVKGENGENLLRKPRLHTTLETLNFLKKINISMVSLAQNHIYDQLEDGFKKTIAFLEKNGILWLGAGQTKKEAAQPQIICHKGIKIGFLNYVTEDTHPNLPENANVYLNIFNEQSVYEDIKNLKSSIDHLVLLLHWGGRMEGELFPDFEQPIIAKKLIDAGADLIIGHHSHSFQPFEIYKGKYIFYSLGNFCLSDFVFEGSSFVMPARMKIAGIVFINFLKNNYTVSIEFFKNNLTTYLKIENYRKKLRFQNFIFKHFLCYKMVWKSYYLYIKYINTLIVFLRKKDDTLKGKIILIFKIVRKRAFNL
ncbi:MAG: CapA family protein [Desulfobacteraceae bacterium]|nr:MAG: CapA family protein [Desulfobacteraceae bacterium]